ncbi:Regulator of sigma D [Serratia odorifera]|nr:Regulator of sigma D [Serratia odorifera]
MALATQIYPKLWINTEQVMAFHDRYSDIEIDQDLCLEFHQALSDIGEVLAARFALEDRLILLAAETWQQDNPDPASNKTLSHPA